MATRPKTRKAPAAGGKLAAYRAKRDFEKTPEPAPRADAGAGGNSFVVQKHAARRLHYDFRLELDGVLKSWAVTKGPSLDPADRRLAVHTEDHPLDYGGFEGVIPAGQYGGGTVLLWDRGTWDPVDGGDGGYAAGRMKFRLHGERMRGQWALVRMKPKGKEKADNWLLIKDRDDEARPGAGTSLIEAAQTSVASGRDMEEIAADRDRVWQSNRGGEPDDPPPDAAKGPRARSHPAAIPGAKAAKLPEFVPPQLATLVDQPPQGDRWLHEIKYDGYRAACRIEDGKARMLTRKGLDWTTKFQAAADAAASIPANSAMIDGEIVVLDTGGASSYAKLKEALSAGRSQDLVYYAFDLLHLDGHDLTRLPLERRKEALRGLLKGQPEDGPLRYSDHILGRGPDFLTNACRLALEGMVSKRRDASYSSGRGGDWLKSKCVLRQEFVIGGFLPSKASGRSLRSILAGYWRDKALVYAGKVGTGFSGSAERDLFARLQPLTRKTSPFASVPPEARRGAVWVKPELVCEVEFTDWTGDGMIRHGSFQGLREDKEPDEVTVEKPAAAPAIVEPTFDAAADAGAGVRLTSPDKVLYPDQGVTKRELADYYAQVGLLMLPHVANRPISLVRCPEGQDGQCFFQRHAGRGLPAAIRPVPVAGKDGSETYLMIDSMAGLLSLVQVGALEIHPWGALADNPDRPDRMIFDFDPGEGVAWSRIVEAALECRDRLAELKLPGFVKTTGGKGLHVVVPLARRQGWPEVKAFAKAVAEAMATDAPGRYVTTMTKSVRRGRIFIDYFRNDRTATAIAPYSTRARPGAPVALPVDWDALRDLPAGNRVTVRNVAEALAARANDPWEDMLRARPSLTVKARRQLGIAT